MSATSASGNTYLGSEVLGVDYLHERSYPCRWAAARSYQYEWPRCGVFIVIDLRPRLHSTVSFHIGLGMAIRYENSFCLHDTVFIFVYTTPFRCALQWFHCLLLASTQTYAFSSLVSLRSLICWGPLFQNGLNRWEFSYTQQNRFKIWFKELEH